MSRLSRFSIRLDTSTSVAEIRGFEIFFRNARDAARFIIFTSLEARTSIRNPRIFFLSAVRNSSVETGNVINDQKILFSLHYDISGTGNRIRINQEVF